MSYINLICTPLLKLYLSHVKLLGAGGSPMLPYFYNFYNIN